MSRFDRLVRAIGPHIDDAEGLLGSVMGRRPEGRAHAALVATDRRLLLVTDRLGGPTVEEVAYGDVTSFERHDGDRISIEVVAPTGRWCLERISDDPSTRVALQLMARRCSQRESESLRMLRAGSGPGGVPSRIRILA